MRTHKRYHDVVHPDLLVHPCGDEQLHAVDAADGCDVLGVALDLLQAHHAVPLAELGARDVRVLEHPVIVFVGDLPNLHQSVRAASHEGLGALDPLDVHDGHARLALVAELEGLAGVLGLVVAGFVGEGLFGAALAVLVSVFVVCLPQVEPVAAGTNQQSDCEGVCVYERE
jgi:hypothetical protein